MKAGESGKDRDRKRRRCRAPTYILIVLDFLQSLDLPQRLVGDAILQPTQRHLLEGHDLASLHRKERGHCQPDPGREAGRATDRCERGRLR